MIEVPDRTEGREGSPSIQARWQNWASLWILAKRTVSLKPRSRCQVARVSSRKSPDAFENSGAVSSLTRT